MVGYEQPPSDVINHPANQHHWRCWKGQVVDTSFAPSHSSPFLTFSPRAPGFSRLSLSCVKNLPWHRIHPENKGTEPRQFLDCSSNPKKKPLPSNIIDARVPPPATTFAQEKYPLICSMKPSRTKEKPYPPPLSPQSSLQNQQQPRSRQQHKHTIPHTHRSRRILSRRRGTRGLRRRFRSAGGVQRRGAATAG